MGIILRLGEIKKRAAVIRLSVLELSRRSGVSRDTIQRDNDTRSSTLEKLTDVLIDEERRMLAHLRELHQEKAGAGNGQEV